MTVLRMGQYQAHLGGCQGPAVDEVGAAGHLKDRPGTLALPDSCVESLEEPSLTRWG